MIIKNGFEFQEIPLTIWDSRDDSLACSKLNTEQTTVEIDGYWNIDGHLYNKVRVRFDIYVENSSSKWVYIPYIYFIIYQQGGGYSRTYEFNLTNLDSSYYQILNIFGSDIDLSQLTLTQSDRLDAKGTYYINWQTYEFQNNGLQLIKNAIKPEVLVGINRDEYMQMFGLILQGLRTLAIEEWLPEDSFKVDLQIYDADKPTKGWIPLRHNAYLYLDNNHGKMHYYDKQQQYNSSAHTYLRLTYYIKEDSYTENSNVPYIGNFRVQNWSSDIPINVSDSNLNCTKTISTIQGSDTTWKKIQFTTYTNIWEQLQCNYPRFGYFSLQKQNITTKYRIYIYYEYTSGRLIQTSFAYATCPNEPHYYINITGWRGDKIGPGDTKIYDVSFLLPSDAELLNDIELSPLEVNYLNVKVLNDENNSFTTSLTDINISEYNDGNLGTAKLVVSCNNNEFSTSTQIEVSLNQRWQYNLSDEHIPVGFVNFYAAPELIIPEDTVLNIYNNKCDKLTFQTHGFSSVDEAEFDITFESEDEAEFTKRKIEFDFQKQETAFNLIFKDNVDDRSKRVFYNFTDKEFTGTIKFTWKVNGEEYTRVHEIPVIYHNDPIILWEPKGNLTIPANVSETSYTFANVMKTVYGYGNIFDNGYTENGSGYVILSDSNIFENAEFSINNSEGTLKILSLKENYYINPRQTRISIYLQYIDDDEQAQYINDSEMWPLTYIDVIQEGLGFIDPVIDDDSLYGVNEEQTILRLNNMVSTPITQNNYSVNMQTLDQPQLTISDDLYFLDASPVYVDGNQKQVILKYYTSLSGIPSVKFTNTDGFLPGISSVSVDDSQKEVIVNMNYNKGQTTQGYVTLTIGNRSVSMGVFQNKSDQYFDLESTSFSLPYMSYGFGIKYTTGTLTPSDIKVRHSSGENIMTSYSVDSQVVIIQIGLNPMLSARTEIIEIYVTDSEGGDAFVQTVILTQGGNPKGMSFSIETADGDNVIFSGQTKTLNGGIYSYGGRPSGYNIAPDPKNTSDYTVQVTRVSGENNYPVFEIVINNISSISKEIEVPVDFKLVNNITGTVMSTKTLVFTLGSAAGILLQPTELIFNYRGVANEGINYITVKKSDGVSNLSITSSLSAFPFTIRVSENYIYITGLEPRISSSPQTWTVNAKADSQDFSFRVTQLASPHTYEYPIWKDIYVDLPDEHNYFRLVNISSGFIMYEGMIYGFITSQVGVTDVLRDYMTTVSDPFVNTFTSSQYLLVDMQTSSDGVNWQSTYTFRLYYNYSYEEDRKVYLEAQPIDYFDSRQYLLFTFQSYDNVQENVEITKTFGTSTPQTQAISAYNEQKTYVSRAASNYSIKIKTSAEERIFKERCTNTNYAVYYINRYGGWSWMLFQGKNLKTDKTQQSTYKMDFDNNIGTEFNTKVYQNDVTETWQLTSDYLTDKQSELLKHLYSSPLVYLHDLKANKVMSVLVDTKSFDYKTYRNQGRKMFTHTIKVNGSQTKIIL